MSDKNEQDRNENNRISEQSREAWEKYGDKAAEKGFVYEREGEGLPDENNQLTPNPAKNLTTDNKSGERASSSKGAWNDGGQIPEDKENSIPETVSMDTEPYDGPSKLDSRLQGQNFESDANQGQQKSHSNSHFIKVPSEKNEDKTLTQNRTFTADSEFNQTARYNPRLGSYVSPEEAAELNKSAEDRD
jgi:hypothetical protein